MADQEMEMGVDFGSADFAEDIDIDLDFPAGEPDEDMDLGDFDRLHGLHNFNSDTRDELMGEGDDASYNMIDAIEIDHNASATATNDIDLDLEHAVESIWQQNPPQSAGFHLETEIEYLDSNAAENMDADRIGTDTGDWMPSVLNSQDALEISLDGGEPEVFSAQEIQEELLLEGSAPWLTETSGSVELLHPEADVAYSSAASNLQEDKQPTHVNDLPGNEALEEIPSEVQELPEEVPETVLQASEQQVEVERNEHGFVQPADNTEAQPHRAESHLENSDEQEEASHPVKTAEVGSDLADDILVTHKIKQPEHTEFMESSSANEDQANFLQAGETNNTDGVVLDQTDGDLYIEATNDRTGVDDAAEAEHPPVGRSGSPSSQSSPQSLEECENKVAPTGLEALADEVGVRDDPVELADHYGVYIAYGDTNYQLFAKSEDDDPNQYFLTDTSALDVSLVQFLANLREVISEEVSPLDDLVMQVDGLGLEFSESTTPDFLGKYTFGDLVVLYDKLVKNESTEVATPIHTYLTVKPNCNRRMMAMGESANAGRGLSEVGLYHDSVDNEQADAANSLDTDSEIGSPFPLENGAVDDLTSDGERQDSPLATVDIQPEHVADSDDDPSEEPDDLDYVKEEIAVSDSAEVIDHQEDVSISTQVEDHAASESSILQTQETNRHDHEDQSSSKSSESSESKVKAPETWPVNSSADATNSESTSVTATLDGEDGEDGDEIDYNFDDDHEDDNEELDGSNVQEHISGTIPAPSAPVDDEITWESDEEEESQNEIQDGLNPDTVQVSPVSGKRARSNSDALDDAGDGNDNKRRRP